MLRRRRLPVAASTVLVCGSLVLSACTGGADATSSSSSESTPASTSSTSTSGSSSPTSTSSGSESSSTPSESSTTPDPYEIDCGLITQSVVDEWVRGGKAASVEPTERGCRVVSSSEDGAVIVEWRWLDVVGSGGDAGILRDQEETSTPITVAPGIDGSRTETDVPPTRKSLTTARIKGRVLFIESTVTLDRRQTAQDMRRIARQIATTYADTTPNPPSEP